MNELRYFDAFSGVAGFSLGIERAFDNQYEPKKSHQTNSEVRGQRNTDEQQAGVRPPDHSALCVGFSEIDKYASQVLRYRYPNTKNYGDIALISPADLPDFDLFTGGFPCQSFSIAGLRKGFSDTRGTLFFEIARILSHKRPRYFLLENVKGLLSHDSGKTFQTILKVLTDLGYDTQWACINAKDFGVPQNRERVFFAGCLGGWGGREVFSFGEGDAKDIVPDGGGQTEVLPTIRATHYKGGDNQPVIQQLNSPTHSNNRLYGDDGISPALNTAQGGNRQPKIAPTIRAEHHNTADVHYIPVLTPDRVEKRQNGRRMKTDGEPMFTLNTQDKHGIYNGMRIRRLTPTECERLMSFPDGWTKYGINEKGEKVEISDSQRYRQCGNGVCSNCVQAIIENIILGGK